jgi:hypothetical protein
MSEVRLVIMEFEDSDTPDTAPKRLRAKMTPIMFDLEKSPLDGGRGLAEAETPPSWGEWVDLVYEDMDALSTAIVYRYAASWLERERNAKGAKVFGADPVPPSRADMFGRLLSDFADRPAELLGNMLACLLIGVVEEAKDDPDFDDVYREWVDGVTASAAPTEDALPEPTQG